jgi:hypothetical protein
MAFWLLGRLCRVKPGVCGIWRYVHISGANRRLPADHPRERAVIGG